MRRLFVILATLFVLPLAAQNEDDARQFQKLAQVFRYLSGLYVDEVEMKPVVEGAITGMLEELDPHSAYIGAEEMKGVQESFDGEFSGIGVEFNVLRDTVIVGSQELEAGAATVKDMRTGEQRQVLLDKLATEICNS